LTVALVFYAMVFQEFLYYLSICLYAVCFVYLYRISSYLSSVFNQYVYMAPVFSLAFFQANSVEGFRFLKTFGYVLDVHIIGYLF